MLNEPVAIAERSSRDTEPMPLHEAVQALDRIFNAIAFAAGHEVAAAIAVRLGRKHADALRAETLRLDVRQRPRGQA